MLVSQFRGHGNDTAAKVPAHLRLNVLPLRLRFVAPHSLKKRVKVAIGLRSSIQINPMKADFECGMDCGVRQATCF